MVPVRSLAALALLALLMPLPAPLAAGQAAAEPLGVRVIEDPTADVKVRIQDQEVAAPDGRFDYVDVVAVDVQEEADGFWFHILVKGFPQQPEVPLFGSVSHRLHFLQSDMTYGIEVSRWVSAGNPAMQAYLLQDASGKGNDDYLGPMELHVDVAAARLSVHVPRLMLLDHNGAPPFPGHALSNFRIVAQTAGSEGILSVDGTRLTSAGARDTAESTTTVPIQLGVAQSGQARLASERPYRASNGEAGFFVFHAKASNLRDVADTFTLQASKVPVGWNITFPQGQLRLDGKSDADLVVLAQVPFTHTHGRLTTFLVELVSQTDAASIGRVELGIHYTDPPQPAGHHPNVYLHSRATDDPLQTAIGATLAAQGATPTMNTIQKDPEDDGAPVTGAYWDIDPQNFPDVRSTYKWGIPLSPGLQMGLDFDLAAAGTASIPIQSTLPMPATRLEGELVVGTLEYQFGSYIGVQVTRHVATLPITDEVDLGANSAHVFTPPILPLRDGDYVPYDPTQELVLLLNVSFARAATITTPEAPSLIAGGELLLPLSEYTDRVTDILGTSANLTVTVTDGQERHVPPAGAGLFTFDLKASPGDYHLAAFGTEGAWVSFPAGQDAVVDASGRLSVPVAVTVPGDAANGTVADLIVEVRSQTDIDTRTVVRLRVVVDKAAPSQHVEVQAAATKPSPGPGAAFLVAAVAFVGAALRRRAAGTHRKE